MSYIKIGVAGPVGSGKTALIEALTRKMAKNYSIGVITNDIYTKEDAQKVLESGADMIQVASRFVATYECDAAPEYKNAYINATQKDIQIIKSPVGMPGRAIRNKFVQRIEKENIPVKKCLSCLSHCNPSQIPYCITNALINAVKGDVDNGLIFCGGRVGSIGRLQTVKDVIEELGINVSQ